MDLYPIRRYSLPTNPALAPLACAAAPQHNWLPSMGTNSHRRGGALKLIRSMDMFRIATRKADEAHGSYRMMSTVLATT